MFGIHIIHESFYDSIIAVAESVDRGIEVQFLVSGHQSGLCILKDSLT